MTGPDGLRDWVRMFCPAAVAALAGDLVEAFWREIEDDARPVGLANLAASGTGDIRDMATATRERKQASGLFGKLISAEGIPPRVQKAGFEWLWRMLMEPRRLFWRYFTTNPRALYAIVRYSK